MKLQFVFNRKNLEGYRGKKRDKILFYYFESVINHGSEEVHLYGGMIRKEYSMVFFCPRVGAVEALALKVAFAVPLLMKIKKKLRNNVAHCCLLALRKPVTRWEN